MEATHLSSTQKYAACALFALALNQSQHHQWRLKSTLPSLDQEPISDGMTAAESPTVSDRPHLWIHEHSGLLLPVFRHMKVEDKAWDGLKETAGTSTQIRHHVGAFIKLLTDESTTSSNDSIKESALLKSIDVIVASMKENEASTAESEDNMDKERRCCERRLHTTPESAHGDMPVKDQVYNAWESETSEGPVEDATLLSRQRKVSVLYELLSACLLATSPDKKHGFISFKGYDSRHRVALRLLATWLDVKWMKMEAMEIIVACNLLDSFKGEVEKRDYTYDVDKGKQGAMVGAAGMAGGTLMALTGGVIAPAIAQGLSSVATAVGAGGLAAAAGSIGSVSGSVAVAASFGAGGAVLCGSKMATRVGGIEDFGFKELGKNHKQGRLAIGIMVSGLVFTADDFLRPWVGQTDNLERYALRWELKNLSALSTAVRDLIASNVAKQLVSHGAMQTVLGSLMTAVAPPAVLVSASDVIDSKWALALDRADKAGKLLAHVLLEGHHGNRPVTLIGFSLGARLIFKCLQHLAESGDHGGLVERVVLLGAPVSLIDENWKLARKVVPGRFINAYSKNDWTLGVAFRTSLVSTGLAGIQPAEVPGIENVDVTDIVEGHASYISKAEEILERLEIEAYHPVWKEFKAESRHEKTLKA